MDGSTINRVVPRENESVNEVWIADRDRFSYQGLSSSDRIDSPMMRVDGELKSTDWSSALAAAADHLRRKDLGVLASPTITLEELYLTQKLGRALGTANIDHRLGQVDMSAQDSAPVMPWLGMQLNDLETLDAALLIGSNIRKDQPIAALRLRKSALKGAAISFINPKRFPLHFEAAETISTRYDNMVSELFCVAKAAGADVSAMADAPTSGCSEQHAQLQYLAIALSKATGATLGMLPERANTSGAWLAGVVPHRGAGGQSLSEAGLDAQAMLQNPLAAYLLVGCELEFDAADPAAAMASLAGANSVVAISAFMSDSLREHADVILPAATFTETFGTYVNATGNWQSARGMTAPPGDARPAWKI